MSLVSAVTQGSREALAILFRRYAGLVRKIAFRVLKDASEADDLVQDVFILIDRCCGTFDSSKASVQLRSYASMAVKRKFLPSAGTGTTIARSSLWNFASVTFALGARCWMVG